MFFCLSCRHKLLVAFLDNPIQKGIQVQNFAHERTARLNIPRALIWIIGIEMFSPNDRTRNSAMFTCIVIFGISPVIIVQTNCDHKARIHRCIETVPLDCKCLMEIHFDVTRNWFNKSRFPPFLTQKEDPKEKRSPTSGICLRPHFLCHDN